MSLYKRTPEGNFYCRFEINGEEIRRSTGTRNKRKAEAFEQCLRDHAWRQIRLGVAQKSFDDACLQWLTEKAEKRSIHSDKAIIRWLRDQMPGIQLDQITGTMIAELRKAKLKTATKSTVNRNMALLRSILTAAAEDWGWLDKAPKVPMYAIEPKEPRWLTPQEFQSFVEHLPPHLSRCARFAVNTGFRSRVIRTLTWDQIQGDQVTISILQAKNAKALTVPLNENALAVIEECKGHHPELVFTREGNSLRPEMVNKAWRKAVKESGLDHVRFHDLRHTWASWHVQAGTPLEVIKELGGWSDLKMVLRYAHLAPSTLQKWAANI
ncbi:MAG: tyrosine-type recombinase/integrase [Pseudomonadota bacterium]